MSRCIAMAGFILLASTVSVDACPFCYSDTGREVGSIVFGKDFGANIVALILPFLLSVGLTRAICLNWPSAADSP
jgi:hypothetical protein